jgi:hypothetical protein
MAGALQRIGNLRRHIGFIMPREYFLGTENPIGLHHAKRHHALAFTEQIRQHPGVGNANDMRAIGHAEIGGGLAIRVRRAFQAAGFHQPTQAKGAIGRWRFAHDVRRGAEKHQIVLKRRQRQRGRAAKPKPTEQQNVKPALLASHGRSPRGSNSANRRLAAAWRRAASSTKAPKPIATSA